MERVADYVIRKVNEAGASCAFMISGRGILYLSDALARNDGIKHVCTYHEQGASYAAMAYAGLTGGIGACLVSTGCASTNAVTACLCAYQDSLPVIFISGNNPLSENTRHTGVKIRTYGSQEADIVSMVESCTKYSVMLENKDSVVKEVEKALFLAMDGRRGPVWIDIPLDVQNMRINEDEQEHYTHGDICNGFEDIREQAEETAREINNAKRPIMLLGGGARSAGKIIRDIVDKFNIPVAFSPSAADIYGSAHKLSIGAVGSLGGSRAGNFAVQNADYILAVGTRLCSQETGMKHAFARKAVITVVDIDKNEHTKDGIHIDRIVNVDSLEFLKMLSGSLLNRSSDDWAEKCIHWKDKFAIGNEQFVKDLEAEDKLDIYSLACILSDRLPDDATVITDAGFEELIIPSAIDYSDGQRCVFPAAQGAMGFAIPAIIGAYNAGSQNIFCIVGDGSFMMNVQELQIISSQKIPAHIIVINNNMYAVIRKRQNNLFKGRTIGNDPSDGVPAPDFKKVAAGFGMEYLRIASRSELVGKLDHLFSNSRPVIIEVMCVPDQIYLHESYGLSEKRRLVHRPIEDMAPFLERDVIRDEMIIELMEG